MTGTVNNKHKFKLDAGMWQQITVVLPSVTHAVSLDAAEQMLPLI